MIGPRGVNVLNRLCDIGALRHQPLNLLNVVRREAVRARSDDFRRAGGESDRNSKQNDVPHRPNMWISRQFRRLSSVLASKSDFLSFLRNRWRSFEFSFRKAAQPAKLTSWTTKLAAKSKGLKPQMQAVLQSCLSSYGALSEPSIIQLEPSKRTCIGLVTSFFSTRNVTLLRWVKRKWADFFNISP